MAFHLAVLSEKPVQHLSVDDWRDKLGRVRNVAVARRADALSIRNASRQLLNEAKIEGVWSSYESTNEMISRVEELDFWRGLIQKAFERLEDKILKLQQEKKAAEEEMFVELEAFNVLPSIIALRDDRDVSELTPDDPYVEMGKEIHILESNQFLLKERCQNAWLKLQRLEDVRFKIRQEIKNKQDTVDTDNRLLALNKLSTDISRKLEPLRNPRSGCSYQRWLEHSKNMKQLTENEMADTVALTDTLWMCVAKAKAILGSQQSRTQYCLRKRIAETELAIRELEWQQQQLKDDLKNSSCAIDEMEAELCAQRTLLMVAETRLETRAMRCVTELCLDNAHKALCGEVEKLLAIRAFLVNKINECKANFGLASEHAKRVDTDLDKKRRTLEIDTKALEMHMSITENITPKSCTDPQATDFNLHLYGIEKDPGK